MKWAILLLALALGACGSSQELAVVSPGDPTWPLNPGRWNATTNDLDQAPVAAPVFTAGRIP